MSVKMSCQKECQPENRKETLANRTLASRDIIGKLSIHHIMFFAYMDPHSKRKWKKNLFFCSLFERKFYTFKTFQTQRKKCPLICCYCIFVFLFSPAKTWIKSKSHLLPKNNNTVENVNKLFLGHLQNLSPHFCIILQNVKDGVEKFEIEIEYIEIREESNKTMLFVFVDKIYFALKNI